ncbi:MAG: hypothetical protein A2156_05060 [Deltaproteobacteria bacterium RBG_16_48_10]|nr:MAG: hypothetical protein A2156_05060 [Deltaproteobacteria bacterium RBG_16_48_10]
MTYETVLKVNNSDLSLRPGMTATADITVKKVENAILIPSAALYPAGTGGEEDFRQPGQRPASTSAQIRISAARWRDGEQKAEAGLCVEE